MGTNTQTDDGEGEKLCKVSGCQRPVGTEDGGTYRQRTFCSERCCVTWEKLEAEAREAQIAESMERPEQF